MITSPGLAATPPEPVAPDGKAHGPTGRAAGQVGGFAALLAAETPRVVRLVHRLLAWDREVDDVVQDVFVAALGAWPRFRNRSTPATWLTRIALNVCRSHIRRRRLARLLQPWRRSESSPDASAHAARHESRDRVRAAVACLSPRHREVIVLVYLEQWPVATAAELLGITANAAHVRLNRARAELREQLGDETAEEWT